MNHRIDTPEKFDALIDLAGGGDALIDHDQLSPEIQELSESYSRGVHVGRTGDLVRANEIYRRVLDRWPTFVAARHNLAANLRTLGDLDRAREQIDRAIDYAAPDAHLLTTAGVIYGDLGDVYSELAMYHRAHTVDPSFKRALFFSVITYRQLGWWTVARGWLEIAEAQLRPVIESSPQYANPQEVFQLEWNWALVHEHFCVWHEAINHLERAYALTRDDGVYMKLQEVRRRVEA